MAIVEGGYPPTGRPRHPILEKHSFEQLHRNEIVETRPHMLHFGGFQIHKEHSHVLKVLNTSHSSLRISIIGPTTQWFRISYDKKGLLAPGMSEDITVTFTPHEWRYYYDTVKVFCGDLAENLVVPLHAYPSANDITLPKVIDFGKVAIGTSKTKRIPLSCKIPIKFEFELAMLESHPDIRISPLEGVIPPDGSTEIVITFAPTRHRTARAELQFHVAQFDFDPVTVAVVGSCAPDLHKDDIVKMSQSELDATQAHGRQDKMMATTNKLKERRNRGALESKPPVHAVESADRSVGGVKVPTGHCGPQAAGYVLSQTAGKLPLKDLNSFIREQRDGLQTLQQEQARKRQEGGHSAGLEEASLAFEEETKQALELRFEMQYREVEKYDRGKELRSNAAPGEDQPTEAEIRGVREARRQRHARILAKRMEADVSRVESVLSQGKVAVPQGYKLQMQPKWDESGNDTFGVRLQVIDRLQRAVTKCLMRSRAQRNASRLRGAMRAAGVVDRESCRTWVDQETKAAAAGAGGEKADDDSKRTKTQAKTATGGLAALEEEDAVAEVLSLVSIPRDFVLPMCIPTSQSGMGAEEREPVEALPLSNFEEFNRAAINLRLDYKVLDYKKFDYKECSVPPPAAYMRPHGEMPRLRGALEEHSIRGPRGSAKDGKEGSGRGAEMPLEMPASCLLPPGHDAMTLLVPSTECRSFVPIPEATECDPEYRLSQLPLLIEPLQTEMLLPSDVMSIENPWLATWRPTRQIQDPFQYLDPMPGSFAEAGGTYGSRLGCDPGGERLSFLPVGGFERDLPSDTDDDECGEFQMPPPSEESYAAARQSLNASLTSERWREEQLAEERLKEKCSKNSRAVRERLMELNEDLSYRGKIYLG